MALAALLHLSAAAAAGRSQPLPQLNTPVDVAVVVEGSLPGFKDDELARFVSQEMEAAHVAAWHFEPAGAAPSANRVVWHFKLLPYAGGSVRYIGPTVSRFKDMFGMRRAIGVDAKLYLNGQFQSTTFDQATIKGGPRDPDLDRVIDKVTRSIIANAFLEEPQPHAKAMYYATLRAPRLAVKI
jgi:hypothetical protein